MPGVNMTHTEILVSDKKMRKPVSVPAFPAMFFSS